MFQIINIVQIRTQTLHIFLTTRLKIQLSSVPEEEVGKEEHGSPYHGNEIIQMKSEVS